jgi:hypothetical protein
MNKVLNTSILTGTLPKDASNFPQRYTSLILEEGLNLNRASRAVTGKGVFMVGTQVLDRPNVLGLRFRGHLELIGQGGNHLEHLKGSMIQGL